MAATLVGKCSWTKMSIKLKRVTYLIGGITMFLMIICGTALFIFAEQLMGIFTPDHEVITFEGSVLRIVSISEPIWNLSNS